MERILREIGRGFFQGRQIATSIQSDLEIATCIELDLEIWQNDNKDEGQN